MAHTQMSISLSDELAGMVRSKVASGEYASESEVIADGLSRLLGREEELEFWLSHEAGPAFDALRADPSRALSAGDVRASLAGDLEITRRE